MVEDERSSAGEHCVVVEWLVVVLIADVAPDNFLVLNLDDGGDRAAAEIAAIGTDVQGGPAIQLWRCCDAQQMVEIIQRDAGGPVRDEHGQVFVGGIPQAEERAQQSSERFAVDYKLEEVTVRALAVTADRATGAKPGGQGQRVHAHKLARSAAKFPLDLPEPAFRANQFL